MVFLNFQEQMSCLHLNFFEHECYLVKREKVQFEKDTHI